MATALPPPAPGPYPGPGSYPVSGSHARHAGPAAAVNTGWRRPDPPTASPAGARPTPDLPTALAGTGVAVAVLGLLNWSSNVVTTGSGGSGGDPSSGARLGGFVSPRC